MTVRAAKPAPQQDELPLSSVRPHDRYPGRTTLYVAEIARDLTCTEAHVINLIEEYELTGGESGLKGFSIARELAPGAKVPRGCWRVALSDFDAFISKRAASHNA